MAKVISEVGKKLVIDCFNSQALAIGIGATLEKIEYGSVWVKFPKHQLTTQHHGYFHGGIISYLADITAGISGFSQLTHPSHSSLTIEFKINFLKAAQGNYLLGKGQVIQETGSMFISKAEIFNEND